MTNSLTETCIRCEERDPIDVASFCAHCADDLGVDHFGDSWEGVSG